MNNFEKMLDNGAFENMDKQIEESEKRFVEMLKTGVIKYNLYDLERLKNKELLNDEEVLLYSTVDTVIELDKLAHELVKILNRKKNVKTMSDFEDIVKDYEVLQLRIEQRLETYIKLNDDIRMYTEDY